MPPRLARALAMAGDRATVVASVDLRPVLTEVQKFISSGAFPGGVPRELPPVPSGEPVPLSIFFSLEKVRFRGGLSIDLRHASDVNSSPVRRRK